MRFKILTKKIVAGWIRNPPATLHTTNCILNLVVGRVRYRYLVPIGSPIFFFLSLRQRWTLRTLLAAAVGPLVIPVPVVAAMQVGRHHNCWPPAPAPGLNIMII